MFAYYVFMRAEDKYLAVIAGLLGIRLCAWWIILRTRSAVAAAAVAPAVV